MLAGMLNILVVFDAWAGPMKAASSDQKKESDAADTVAAAS
jgi:hypothetical protein